MRFLMSFLSLVIVTAAHSAIVPRYPSPKSAPLVEWRVLDTHVESFPISFYYRATIKPSRATLTCASKEGKHVLLADEIPQDLCRLVAKRDTRPFDVVDDPSEEAYKEMLGKIDLAGQKSCGTEAILTCRMAGTSRADQYLNNNFFPDTVDFNWTKELGRSIATAVKQESKALRAFFDKEQIKEVSVSVVVFTSDEEAQGKFLEKWAFDDSVKARIVFWVYLKDSKSPILSKQEAVRFLRDLASGQNLVRTDANLAD